MIVLFTEFTDLASADFMVRAARRMVETHLLLVVCAAGTRFNDCIAAVTAAHPQADVVNLFVRCLALGALTIL